MTALFENDLWHKDAHSNHRRETRVQHPRMGISKISKRVVSSFTLRKPSHGVAARLCPSHLLTFSALVGLRMVGAQLTDLLFTAAAEAGRLDEGNILRNAGDS
jgi:hypothetical protein